MNEMPENVKKHFTQIGVKPEDIGFGNANHQSVSDLDDVYAPKSPSAVKRRTSDISRKSRDVIRVLIEEEHEDNQLRRSSRDKKFTTHL